MDLLGIKESLDRMAKASSIRWYGHVLRNEDENVIVKDLKFEVSGSRARPKVSGSRANSVDGDNTRSNKPDPSTIPIKNLFNETDSKPFWTDSVIILSLLAPLCPKTLHQEIMLRSKFAVG